MPAKNVIKQYLVNGYYHLYNRGVEKREIFMDRQDEGVFLSYLKEYLTLKDTDKLQAAFSDSRLSYGERIEAAKLLRMNNFSDSLDLLAYCLMGNHFHLLVKQTQERTIETFMRSLCTRYVQYFNKRHGNRVGGLFQSTYKAVLVQSEEQLWHLSRYIHRNPAMKGLSLVGCLRPSSYQNYLGLVSQVWVKPGEILGYFAKSGFNSYESFVENDALEEESLARIPELLMDI